MTRAFLHTYDSHRKISTMLTAYRSIITLLILLLCSESYADTVSRGPYLQRISPSSAIVRWRSVGASDSVVLYGSTQGSLNNRAEVEAPRSTASRLLASLQAQNTFTRSAQAPSGLPSMMVAIILLPIPRLLKILAFGCWEIQDEGMPMQPLFEIATSILFNPMEEKRIYG